MDKVEAVEAAFQEEIESFYTSAFASSRRSGPTYGQKEALASEGGEAELDTELEVKAEWQETEPSGGSGYFKVELPSGKHLYCVIPVDQRIDMQFGRNVLAKALNIPQRAFWKNCVKSPEEERKDSVAFKNVFKDYDFTLL